MRGVGMRAQLPIAVAVAALLTLVGEGADATKFSTITVSNNADSVSEFHSRIKNGVVVWQRGTGASSEVMRWNGAIGVPLTQNGVADENPETDGVHVVWQETNGAQRDIAIYDLVTHVTTILTSPDDEVTPLVSGTTLAWVRYYTGDLDGEVFIDPGPPGNQLTGNTLVESGLQLDGDNLVWSQGDDLHLTPGTGDDQHDIAVWNGALQGLFILGGNPTDDIRPSISGNTVVWQAGPDGAGDIWVGDTQGSANLLYDGTDERNPQTDGQHVVWEHWDGTDFEISEVDLASPNNMVVKTNDAYDDVTPQVEGDTIVWVKKTTPGDSEIWVSWHGGPPEVVRGTNGNGRDDVRPRLDVDGEHFIFESCTNLGQPNELCDVVLAPEVRATLAAGVAVAMLAGLASRSARRAAEAGRSS
jgi:hypothetical protein